MRVIYKALVKAEDEKKAISDFIPRPQDEGKIVTNVRAGKERGTPYIKYALAAACVFAVATLMIILPKMFNPAPSARTAGKSEPVVTVETVSKTVPAPVKTAAAVPVTAAAPEKKELAGAEPKSDFRTSEAQAADIEKTEPQSAPQSNVSENVSTEPLKMSDIKLSGIISDETSSLAIVNGKAVVVGESVLDGVRVVKIEKDSITVESQGKEYVIRK